MTYTIRTECRLCDARLPDERVLDLGSTVLANALEPDGLLIRGPEYPLYLKQCSACGHCQLPVVVDPKLLFPPDYPYQSATGASMREHLKLMARDIEPELFAPELDLEQPLVAEIGSNDGYLLDEFRRRGFRVVGVDPALALASRATQAGSLTVPAFFDRWIAHTVKNACGEADLIVANNVFAHADDLHEIVEGVKVLLAPEGRFVFEVGYLPDVLAANNFGTVYHEHLSYHHLTPLVAFFSRHGMMVTDFQRVATQGGSMRVTVRHAGAQENWSAAVEGILNHSYGEWTTVCERLFTEWQSRVNFAAGKLAGKLRGLKAQGKSIAAYGCSAKSTTLLHVAGIGRETIDWIADDAPTKQGKFSPGKHIPIVPGSWLEEKQPDYCVSLSGNFSEAFKAQHPEFRGEWIEPDLGGA